MPRPSPISINGLQPVLALKDYLARRLSDFSRPDWQVAAAIRRVSDLWDPTAATSTRVDGAGPMLAMPSWSQQLASAVRCQLLPLSPSLASSKPSRTATPEFSQTVGALLPTPGTL